MDNKLAHLNKMQKLSIKQFHSITEIEKMEYFNHYVKFQLTTLKEDFSSLKSVITSLMSNRLSPEIIYLTNLTDIMVVLKEKAEVRGFLLIPQSTDHLYQMETTYISNRDGMDIFVRVPMARTQELLTMYKYENAPLPITGTKLMIEIQDFYDVLAISSNKQFFRTMRFYDLYSCDKISNLYLCPKQNVLRSIDFLEDTCLGALYNSDSKKIISNCPHTFLPPTDTILQISPRNFLSYFPNEEKVMITCYAKKHNKWTYTSNPFLLSGYQEIQLDTNCVGETQSHKFSSDINIESDTGYISFDRQFVEPYGNFGISSSNLEEMRQEYDEMNKLPQKIQHMQNFILQRHDSKHLFISMIIGAVFIGFFCILLFYQGCTYYKTSQKVKQVQSSYFEASAPPKV
jgi:hypothetical protein